VSNTIEIRSFELCDLEQIKIFTDKWIGTNYFSLSDLDKIHQQSCLLGKNASLLAFDDKQLVGVRLSLAPNQWVNSSSKISPQLWSVDPKCVAYFKSLFIHDSYRKKGLGPLMSSKSEEILVQMGAKAILTHSWLESPNNSSQEYLLKYHFIELARHSLFWNDIDYLCTRCAPRRCECTAVEMIKYIDEKNITENN
jgi:hypothetical protein